MSPLIPTVLAGCAVVLAAPTAAALAYRKLRQLKTAQTLKITSPDGIVEERFVRIGGIDQWIGIRGEHRDNPVLLVVHGGPGFPYSPCASVLRRWEKYFTIVEWDQRGAGKTFGRSGKAGTGELTFDRLAADGLEVAEFLRSYLRQRQIILLASSAGTLVGLPMVQRRPDLFSAYVGTDLNVHTLRAETLTYQVILERLRTAHNKKGVVILEAMGPDSSRWDIKAWTRKQQLTMQADPLMRDLPRTLLLGSPLTSPTHTLRDVWHVFAGQQFSQTQLFTQLIAHDAWRWGTRFEVPFFLFQGDSDLFTPTALAQEYFADVDAPIKKSALIKNAGHFAAFTQPDQFLAELLAHVRPLVVVS
ncbi:MAG: alpha/beta fold hydrolase, partial [Ktedonobacterales bacterium]